MVCGYVQAVASPSHKTYTKTPTCCDGLLYSFVRGPCVRSMLLSISLLDTRVRDQTNWVLGRGSLTGVLDTRTRHIARYHELCGPM